MSAADSSAGAGYVRSALLAARDGKAEKAFHDLDRALAEGAGDWALGVRGAIRAKLGDLEAAREDLDRALRRECLSWVLSERAEVLRRLGLFPQALKDLDGLKRMLPGSPEPDARAAAVHLDQAQYPQAAARLTRALRLTPERADLFRGRAEVHFVRGDLSEARRDMARACALAPQDGQLLQEKLRLDILAGDDDAVQSQLGQGDAGLLGPAIKEYWLGYLRCRQGRYKAAQEHFRSVASSSQIGDLGRRANFYRHVARVLGDAESPPTQAEGELLVMGLGYRQPTQVSSEVIGSMKSCELIYSNLSDAAVVDFLGLFPAPFKAIVFRRSDQQSTICAREVMAGFKKVRRVGVVTRGNPVFYGRLAYRLTIDCAKRGVRCRVPASLSIADTITSLVGAAPSSALGVQIRDASNLLRINRRLPLVIYNLPAASQRRRQYERLKSLYPRRHPCSLLPGSGDMEFLPNTIAMERLWPSLRSADFAVTLFLPAAHGGGAVS